MSNDMYESETVNDGLLQILRDEINQKIFETDKYIAPDWPHSSDEIRQAWSTYQQALRDLRDLPPTFNLQCDASGNLTNVPWPIPPS